MARARRFGALVAGDGLADVIVGAHRANGSRSGRSYVVFSPLSPPTASGPYQMKTLAGDGPGGMVAPVSDFGPVARVKINFSDGDMATGGGLNGSSSETATIVRNSKNIANLNSNAGLADVIWEITTNRIGFDTAEVTLKYLDGELDGILGGESVLRIFTASVLSGPWTGHPTGVNSARNEVKAIVSGFSYFALGGVIESDPVWIDFGYTGVELGTIMMPFNTVAEGVAAVIDGGTIFIRGDTGTPSTSETITIVRPLRLEASGGAVRIGQ